MAVRSKSVPTSSASAGKLTRRPAQALAVQGAEQIPASKAKAHFLQLLDKVDRNRTPFTITKRGRVIAHLVPVPTDPRRSIFDQMYGRTEGWMEVTGDIVSPDHESWGPDWQ